MKSQQRHQLKQNEFAATVGQVVQTVRDDRQRIIGIVLVVVLVAGAIGGYFVWRQRGRNAAGALYASAVAVSQSAIAPAPTVPGAVQAPGTFPNAKARSEAALAAFQNVAKTYPSSPDGLAAAYQAADALFALGRLPEAEKAYADVITRAGAQSLYGSSARLGLAETLAAQSQYDRAIKEYTDLAAQRDGILPVDGILVGLARTYAKAGKTADARATFKRVVDEFPTSAYANEARTQMVLLG
jgi:TolA-binding protein